MIINRIRSNKLRTLLCPSFYNSKDKVSNLLTISLINPLNKLQCVDSSPILLLILGKWVRTEEQFDHIPKGLLSGTIDHHLLFCTWVHRDNILLTGFGTYLVLVTVNSIFLGISEVLLPKYVLSPFLKGFCAIFPLSL